MKVAPISERHQTLPIGGTGPAPSNAGHVTTCVFDGVGWLITKNTQSPELIREAEELARRLANFGSTYDRTGSSTGSASSSNIANS